MVPNYAKIFCTYVNILREYPCQPLKSLQSENFLSFDEDPETEAVAPIGVQCFIETDVHTTLHHPWAPAIEHLQ
jgi:hypothetical protein